MRQHRPSPRVGGSIRCVPIVEPLESRRLLAVATIGTNLDGLADWATIGPFNDLATLFRPWGRPGTPYQPDPTLPVNADNYPLADAGTITYARGYPEGEYQVAYDGAGSLHFDMSCTAYTVTSHVGDHWTGVLDLHFDPGGGGILTMTVTGVDPANPLRNLHIISPDADTGISDTFRPVFLQKVAPFNGPLRMMDWMQTNGSPVVGWADRSRPTRFSYTSASGIPVEQLVALANIAGKDVWVNVPVSATDQYVTSLAALLRDTLDPTLKVYVEYSNELWNGIFQQAAVNADNALDDDTLSDIDPFGRQAEEAAKQLVRISDLFRGEFGGARFAAQVRPVFGAFIAGSYWAQCGLEYIQRTYGDPRNFISGIAVAPYVGVQSDLDRIDDQSLTADHLFAWMHNFIDTTVDPWLAAHKTLADRYGLQLEAYEAGQSLTAGNHQNETLKEAAQDDPRMGDILEHLVNTWVANGGHVFANFSLASPYSPYGYWGALRCITDPTSVKYAALLALLGRGEGGGGPPDLVPPAVIGAAFDENSPLDVGPADFVVVRFSEAAGPLIPADAVQAVSRTTGQPVTPASVRYDSRTQSAVITFAPGSLPDGTCDLVLRCGAVTDAAGNPLDGDGDGSPGGDFIFSFAFLLGDVNRDGTVDPADRDLVEAALGLPAVRRADGDVDGDRTVGFADLLAVVQQYGNPAAGLLDADVDADGEAGFADLLAVAQSYDRNGATDIDGSGTVDDADLAIVEAAISPPTSPPLIRTASAAATTPTSPARRATCPLNLPKALRIVPRRPEPPGRPSPTPPPRTSRSPATPPSPPRRPPSPPPPRSDTRRRSAPAPSSPPRSSPSPPPACSPPARAASRCG